MASLGTLRGCGAVAFGLALVAGLGATAARAARWPSMDINVTREDRVFSYFRIFRFGFLGLSRVQRKNIRVGKSAASPAETT